ncbi:MAG: hypothetical protein ACYC9L_03020 [Sulfuricaulis sp.]
MPRSTKSWGTRDRMRLVIQRAEAPELFESIESLVARAKGVRVRYLATLGLKAERVGAHLEGDSLAGKLVLPAALLPEPVVVAAHAAAATPAAETKPAEVVARKAEFSAFAMSVLNLGNTPSGQPAPKKSKAAA